jgi:YihY family inner membrane protein
MVVGLAEQVVRSRGRRDLKQLGSQVAAAMDRHGVLTDATAIAFRMLFALAFLSLTGLAFAGAVHLEGIWRHQIGPNIARAVSPNFYRELDHSVDQVLTTRRWWWLSIGLVLTVWQVSSGVRALMTAFDSIYEVKDRRPFWERMAISIGLALLIIVTLFVIAAALLLSASGSSTPMALRVGETIVRFGFSAVVLLLLVAVLLRFTTPAHLLVKWVTVGSSITIAIWLAASWLFGWYVANFAYRGYQQAFGVLSLLIVVMTYLFVASVAFLVGAELDALLVTEANARGKRSSRRRN